MADGSAPPELAIYIENLDGGGVQITRTRLAGELARRGRRIAVLAGRASGVLRASLPETIAVHEIAPSGRVATSLALKAAPAEARGVALAAAWLNADASAALSHVPSLAVWLRRVRPRALMAATPYLGLEALLARRQSGLDLPVIVSEHNDLHAGHPYGHGRHRKLLPRLQRALYPEADAIVAVSAGVADDIATRAGIDRAAIRVIHNPAVTADLAERAAEPVAHPWFAPGEPPVVLAVGRLGAAKDFPMLIRAFAALRARRLARLIILGKGPSEKKTRRRQDEYRQLAGFLGIEADLDLPGFAANPFAWMARAAVLAVSSRHEGFGNVIPEALACGTPVVSTDCPSGPAEILAHGEYGRLVPVGDALAMAEALAATLDEPPDRARLRARGAAFSVARAADAYEVLLAEVVPSWRP